MAYDIVKISMTDLMRPAFDAGIALARVDERIACSPVGIGAFERVHFADSCASLWIDGELVHLEDLVLHDAIRHIRTPTHELTIARDVLRTRRRIAAQLPDWPLSQEGIRNLRQMADINSVDVAGTPGGTISPALNSADGDGGDDADNLPGVDYAAIDALLIRGGD
ncbi:hypothetical protein N434_04968 [Rhizobium sp. UGM030330-04]|nr:hypothetical protein N434_04968 [Rhizobium sp. UGM030330-04]